MSLDRVSRSCLSALIPGSTRAQSATILRALGIASGRPCSAPVSPPRQLAPHEERALLTYGIGITNLVPRTTAAAAELSKSELAAGGRRLVAKVHVLKPHVLAFLGIEAYRTAFGAKHVKIGPQPESIGTTQLWVLPNPSGLNAHYQLSDFARLFRRLSMARNSVRG